MKLMLAVEMDELAALNAQWGAAPLQTVELDVDDPFLTGDHQRLVSDGRRAEVCYIMHRGDPAAGVLLHIKTIYPEDAYRLPTGGVQQGEQVLETLSREIAEETGLSVGEGADAVEVQRFLGVLRYVLRHRGLGRTYDFATYHFLVQMPAGASLQPADAAEMIGGWRWCPPAELAGVGDRLETVGRDAPVWADWGRYRALSQRFVAAALASPERNAES